MSEDAELLDWLEAELRKPRRVFDAEMVDGMFEVGITDYSRQTSEHRPGRAETLRTAIRAAISGVAR